MGDLGWGDCVRRATSEDDGFLYDVFCTTWQTEVTALPNPNLVHHFLRIQFTAQNRRFQQRFPDFERWVVMSGDKRAGRLFLHRTRAVLSVVEITLLPEFRSGGLGTRVLRRLTNEAVEHGQTVSLRVERRNLRAANLYNTIGFRLVGMDDQDSYFEWAAPVTHC